MEMSEVNKDLNQYSEGNLFRFWHSRSASMRIWNETRGGMALFPYDPMTEKVRNIRKYRIYSEDSLRKAYEKVDDFGMTLEKAREGLIAKGCTFVGKLPFAYTDKEVEYINYLFRKMYPGNFS